MEGLNQAEAQVLVWIQENIRTEVFDWIMPFLSEINNAGFLAVITVLVLLIWRRYRCVGITAAVSLVTEFVFVNVLLKNLLHRTRPYVENEDLILLGDQPGDFSFPSGHTGSAFAVAIVMFLCMPKRYGVPAVIVASLIALSRIYNAAHYPTDVLGAVLVAAFTGMMSYKLVYPRISKRLSEGGNTDKE